MRSVFQHTGFRLAPVGQAFQPAPQNPEARSGDQASRIIISIVSVAYPGKRRLVATPRGLLVMPGGLRLQSVLVEPIGFVFSSCSRRMSLSPTSSVRNRASQRSNFSSGSNFRLTSRRATRLSESRFRRNRYLSASVNPVGLCAYYRPYGSRPAPGRSGAFFMHGVLSPLVSVLTKKVAEKGTFLYRRT